MNPNNDAVIFNKATALCMKGEYEQALDCYDLAISITPDDLYNWLAKAATLGDLDRHLEVLEHLAMAEIIDVNGVKGYFAQVKVQADIVEHSLREVLRSDPANREAERLLDQFFG